MLNLNDNRSLEFSKFYNATEVILNAADIYSILPRFSVEVGKDELKLF